MRSAVPFATRAPSARALRRWLASAWIAFALACTALAAVAATDVPELAQHVTDLTGTLAAGDIAALEQRLVALEQRKGSQVAVLVVPTTGDESLEAYSLAVFERKQLGRKGVDDGLLLLVAKDDRRARIEVGRGLEGVVTDAIASRIIREYLAPKFRAGDYAGGIGDAVGAIEKLIDGEPLPAPMADAPDGGQGGGANWPIGLFIGLFVGSIAARTGIKPALFRRAGAGVIAGGIGLLLLGAGLGLAVAAILAFLMAGTAGGRYIGSPGWGGGGFGGGGGGFGGGGGGGWSGGGGGAAGGGASGGW